VFNESGTVSSKLKQSNQIKPCDFFGMISRIPVITLSEKQLDDDDEDDKLIMD